MGFILDPATLTGSYKDKRRQFERAIVDYYGPGVAQVVSPWIFFHVPPDMGATLGKINTEQGKGWNYWTIRIVDGLFQNKDAINNRDTVFESLELSENIGGVFDNWAEEVDTAVIIADYIQNNVELWEYLREWEHLDTETRRAEQRAERLSNVLVGLTAFGAFVGTALAVGGSDTPVAETISETQSALNTAGGMLEGAEEERATEASEKFASNVKLFAGITAAIIGVIWLGKIA